MFSTIAARERGAGVVRVAGEELHGAVFARPSR